MKAEFIFGKIGLFLTFSLGSMSLLELQDALKLFCLVGSIFSSLAAGLYYSLKAIKESKSITMIQIINYLKTLFKNQKSD